MVATLSGLPSRRTRSSQREHPSSPGGSSAIALLYANSHSRLRSFATEAGSAVSWFPETRRILSAHICPSSSGSSRSLLPISLRLFIPSHRTCEPRGMTSWSAFPCASSRSSAPASGGSLASLLAGAEKSVSFGEVKGGRAVITLESAQNSWSTGRPPTSSGRLCRKFPLRKTCSSAVSWPTSFGTDSRPSEMSTSAFSPWHRPISGGRLRSARHDEIRISMIPSIAKAAGGGAGSSAGGHCSTASARRASS
mmetsp:Transcript_71572/g.213569  ORF Transcript_71572/g.213569 Transcript_71572/m.213569 type:complete len:252 (+) Transcript_71572:277-1032(+)